MDSREISPFARCKFKTESGVIIKDGAVWGVVTTGVWTGVGWKGVGCCELVLPAERGKDTGGVALPISDEMAPE